MRQHFKVGQINREAVKNLNTMLKSYAASPEVSINCFCGNCDRAIAVHVYLFIKEL